MGFGFAQHIDSCGCGASRLGHDDLFDQPSIDGLAKGVSLEGGIGKGELQEGGFGIQSLRGRRGLRVHVDNHVLTLNMNLELDRKLGECWCGKEKGQQGQENRPRPT